MKKICCVVLIFLALVSIVCITGCGKPEQQVDIDVMSFNIRNGNARDGENNWENRTAQVVDLIRQHAPDFVGLQEAHRYQIDAIRSGLPEYAEIGISRQGGTKDEYSAILYRNERFGVGESGTFWLSDTPEVPSAHWGNEYLRICTWGQFVDKQTGFALYLYNTHLDHQSQEAREKSVRLIADRIHDRPAQAPYILTGDFNAGEDNPAVLYLKGEEPGGNTSPVRVVDTFRILYPDENVVGTFHAFKGTTDGDKIDYIFVEPTTRTLQASIVRSEKNGRYPSDHFPVTASIRF